MDSLDNKDNKIEIVNGTGNELNISEVDSHLPIEKPKITPDGHRKIIIPKNKN